MNRTFLLAILTGLLSVGVRADYDPALEAREAAQRKAEQQRAAKQKAERDKVMRETSAKVYRQALDKDAVGKSDAEVERIYKQRQNAAVQQAQSAEAAMKTSGRQMKESGDSAGIAEGDAAMKAMYGKSMSDIGNMSEKEREAFMKAMEKRYGGK